MYSCATVLSLTENGVRHDVTILSELCKAQAVGFLYMAASWYFSIGVGRRIRRYERMNFATVSIVFTAGIMAAVNVVAPYGYSREVFSFTVLSPFFLVIVAFVTTMWVQDVEVNDVSSTASKVPPDSWNYFSGGKAYASTIIILYGLLYVLYFLGELISTYRVPLDNWPDISLRFDPTLPNLILGSNI